MVKPGECRELHGIILEAYGKWMKYGLYIGIGDTKLYRILTRNAAKELAAELLEWIDSIPVGEELIA